MATVIRLKRGGRTHAPYYRVVVMDGRQRTLGRVIEEIGVYHPCARPEPRTEIDTRRALKWLRDGAQPSDTVRSVLAKKGVMEMYAKGTKPEDLPEEAPAEEAAAPAETTEAAVTEAAEPSGETEG
jgi:small subunit ribosomal protein S16